MMQTVVKHILLSLSAFFCTSAAYAQDLPVLPSDKAVVHGILSNGTSYYVVTNKASKGMADFALVQKTGTATAPEKEKAVSVAQDALAFLPRLTSCTPQEFLVAHGVTPLEDGFVEITDNATVFRFTDVLLSSGKSVVDSTLLVLLDIADRCSTTEDDFVRKWYTPADQAIIVSGDIDRQDVVDKLEMMSLMTPALPSLPRKEHEWKVRDTAIFMTSVDLLRNLSTICATWNSPRTPREYMNTVQPAIYDMFISELGTIVNARIRATFRDRNIPLANISCRHVDSMESLTDESFSVSVTVRPEDASEAVGILASVMAAIDGADTSVWEFVKAKHDYVDRLVLTADSPLVHNHEYVDRCITAFLYNATLASQKEKLDFHLSRTIPDTTELELFNGIARALIDSTRNLTVTYSAGKDAADDSLDVKALFRKAWRSRDGFFGDVPPERDTFDVPEPGGKVKLKSVRTEHLSGGLLWMFSNGFKVAYRQMDTGGRLYYSLSMNGGYSNMKDISQGEGAYMSDYLSLCRIGGMDRRSFRAFLRDENMSLDSKVSLYSTSLSGSVPEEKAELMLQVLIASLYDREHDAEAFEYYVSNERLRGEWQKGTLAARIVAIDSIMCPGYAYSIYKTSGIPTIELGRKADEFYRQQAGKMNDGLLVLVGNMDETRLKKLLSSYAGSFVTTDKAFPRNHVHYQPVSGSSTYTMEGQSNSVDIAMSALMPLTAENYMTASIASMVLRQCVSKAIAGTGMYLRLSSSCNIYPQERFNVMLSLNEGSVQGFAEGTAEKNPIEALTVVRSVLENIADMEITDAELSAYKDVLAERLSLEMKEPVYWTEAIARRYIDGKDFTTGYDDKIAAVDKTKVKELLSLLCHGSKVEYIIRN